MVRRDDGHAWLGETFALVDGDAAAWPGHVLVHGDLFSKSESKCYSNWGVTKLPIVDILFVFDLVHFLHRDNHTVLQQQFQDFLCVLPEKHS